MSTTTTVPASTLTLNEVLRDYDLHHSGRNEDLAAPAPGTSTQTVNPPEWDTTHRRVPRYRPANRDLDQTQRRVYNNGIERTFITVMFTGVYLNAVRIQAFFSFVDPLT
jgi:hypothetical protein